MGHCLAGKRRALQLFMSLTMSMVITVGSGWSGSPWNVKPLLEASLGEAWHRRCDTRWDCFVPPTNDLVYAGQLQKNTHCCTRHDMGCRMQGSGIEGREIRINVSSTKRVDLTTLCHDYPMNVLLVQFESTLNAGALTNWWLKHDVV